MKVIRNLFFFSSILFLLLPLPYDHYTINFFLFLKKCTEPGLQRMQPARCCGLVFLGVNTFRKTPGWVAKNLFQRNDVDNYDDMDSFIGSEWRYIVKDGLVLMRER